MKIYSLAAGAIAAALVIGFPRLGHCSGTGHGQPAESSEQSNQQTFGMQRTLTSNDLRKHNALTALRDEGLKLRQADGGTLTPAHEAYLQAKLDAIEAGNY